MANNKKAQIWIETVIYTLIGLALISLVLAFVLPKLKQNTDRIIIEQAVEDLNNIDNAIRSVTYAPGNIRVREFRIKKGKLVFNCTNEKIYFEMEDSSKMYSEPGTEAHIGNLNVSTTQKNDLYDVKIELNYKDYLDITYTGENAEKTFQKAPAPYKISIENKGFDKKVTKVDIVEIS